MESIEDVHIEGRVTRSLRKRLTSIDSDVPSSRPGTPIGSKLASINENSSPNRSTRRTRRNSATNTTTTPLKTPSKAVQGRVALASGFDMSTEESSPFRRCTRRLSTNIPIIKEEKQAVKMTEEKSISTRVTRSTSKSPQELKATDGTENDSNSLQSSAQKRERSNKNGTKLKSTKGLSNVDDDHSDIEIINLEDNDTKETDYDEKKIKASSGESMVIVLDGSSPPHSNNNKIGTIKVEETSSNRNNSLKDRTSDDQPKAEKNKNSNCDGKQTSESLKNGLEQNTKSNKLTEIIEVSLESNNDKNYMTYKKNTSDSFKEIKHGDTHEKSLSTPERCTQGLVIEVLELSTLNPQKLADLLGSAVSSPAGDPSTHKSVSFKDLMEETMAKSCYPKTPRSTKCKSYTEEDLSNKEIDKNALAQAENILKTSTANVKGEAYDASKTPFKPVLNKIQSSTPISSSVFEKTAIATPSDVAVSHTIPTRSGKQCKQAESGLLSRSPEIMPNNNNTPAFNNETDDSKNITLPERAHKQVNRKSQSPESSTMDNTLVMHKDFKTSELGEDGHGHLSSKTPSPRDDNGMIGGKKPNSLFASSWAQSVAASAEAGSKIDNISAELEQIPIICKGTESFFAKPQPTDQTPKTIDKTTEEDELNINSDSDNEIGNLEENEKPYKNNSFVFKEAEDAGDDYKSGDSMCSDERREILENEILVDGESINSETENEEEDEMESEDDASFIVQDSEVDHYSQEDSDEDDENCSIIKTKINDSNSKAFKRILKCQSSSSSESEEILNVSSLHKKEITASRSQKSNSFTKNGESSFGRSPKTEQNQKAQVESNQKSTAEELCKIKAFTSTGKDICSTYSTTTTAETVDAEKKSSNVESDTGKVNNIDGNIIESLSQNCENISCFNSCQLSETARNLQISDSREENHTEELFNEDEIKKSNSSKKLILKKLRQSEVLNKTVQEFKINKQTKISSPEFLSTNNHGTGRRAFSLEGCQALRKSLPQYRSKQLPSTARTISSSSDSTADDNNEDSKKTENENLQAFHVHSFCKYNQRCPSSTDESNASSVCVDNDKVKNKNKPIAEEKEEKKIPIKNQRSNESSSKNDYEYAMNQGEDGDDKYFDVLKKYPEKRQSHPNMQTKSKASDSLRMGEVSTISIYDTEEDSESNTNISTNKERKPLTKSTSGLSVSFGEVSKLKESSAIQGDTAHSSFTIGISVKRKIRDTTPQPLLTSESSSDAKEENPNSESETVDFSTSEGEEKTNHLKNGQTSGKRLSTELPSRRHSFTVNPEAIMQETHSVKIKNAEKLGSEIKEPNLSEQPTSSSGAEYAQPENELVDKKTVKRKRLSNSYCGGGSLDNTELEINIGKKYKRDSIGGGLEQISTSKAAVDKSNKSFDGSSKNHIQKILSRCDEILEAANQAKLEAKLNYNKSKVKIPKQKKRKEIFEEAEESKTEILTEKEHKRKERAKMEIEKALKASEDIILNNPANKLRPITKHIADDDQSNTYRPPSQRKMANGKEAFFLTQPTVCHKNILPVQKLKSSAGEVTAVSLKVQKKKSHIKIQLPTGTVRVEPVTPTKHGHHNGFRESPVTPRSVGFKVRHILTAGQDTPPDVPTELNQKYKRRRKIEEPQNTLPKPQWTQSGVFIEEDLYPTIPVTRTGSTQFVVSALSSNRRKPKKSPNAVSTGDQAKGSLCKLGKSSTAHSFKRSALFRDNIPRESSHEVILRKKRQHFRSHF